MKNLHLLLLLLIGVASCNEIEYTTPQPKGIAALEKLPKKLQGTFVTYENGEAKDTIQVTEQGITKPSGKTAPSPGDTLVYKYYKHTYFASLRDDAGFYLLTVVKVERNGDVVIHQAPSDEKSFSALRNEVSRIVSIDSTVRDGDKHYVIDPSPKQLMRMVHKGLFSEKQILKKISP